MREEEADIKADTQADIENRGEGVGLLEPLLIGEHARRRTRLSDLAVDLAAKSAGLRRSLSPEIVTALAGLVRAINCYYSNLIEGHNTHPVDIERALRGDYSSNPEKRTLQLEARAHIAVQVWIDEGGLDGRALTAEGLREIHKRFCDLLPDQLLRMNEPQTNERLSVTPGAWRTRDVQVGRHVPVSPGTIPRFLARFESAYRKLGRTDSILVAATAHHRLLWIHPFLDGNGRVARLMSYAVLRETLDTGGIWSIARGLARNESAYKAHLAACDQPRRNDLDGRGRLSEEALSEFTAFFLTTCIDQVEFMEQLIRPHHLRDRILIWAEEEIRGDRLPPHAGAVLEAVLYRGALPRSDVAKIIGTSDRQARRVTSALLDSEILTATSTRAPLHLGFPAALASRWLPGLFPEKR